MPLWQSASKKEKIRCMNVSLSFMKRVRCRLQDIFVLVVVGGVDHTNTFIFFFHFTSGNLRRGDPHFHINFNGISSAVVWKPRREKRKDYVNTNKCVYISMPQEKYLTLWKGENKNKRTKNINLRWRRLGWAGNWRRV